MGEYTCAENVSNSLITYRIFLSSFRVIFSKARRVINPTVLAIKADGRRDRYQRFKAANLAKAVVVAPLQFAQSL